MISAVLLILHDLARTSLTSWLQITRMWRWLPFQASRIPCSNLASGYTAELDGFHASLRHRLHQGLYKGLCLPFLSYKIPAAQRSALKIQPTLGAVLVPRIRFYNAICMANMMTERASGADWQSKLMVTLEPLLTSLRGVRRVQGFRF